MSASATMIDSLSSSLMPSSSLCYHVGVWARRLKPTLKFWALGKDAFSELYLAVYNYVNVDRAKAGKKFDECKADTTPLPLSAAIFTRRATCEDTIAALRLLCCHRPRS